MTRFHLDWRRWSWVDRTDSGTGNLQYFTRTTNVNNIWWSKKQICELSKILGPRTREIIGVKQMEYEDFGWRSISLFFERVERIITVKVYVISESILCQGEVNNPSTANEAWRKKIEWYGKNNFLEDLNGIDCRKTEFVLRIFPRSTA